MKLTLIFLTKQSNININKGDEMSQQKIYEVINSCGGKASRRMITDIVKEKYPNTTMHVYISNRLKRLEKKGIIKKIEHKTKDNCYIIIAPYYDIRKK